MASFVQEFSGWSDTSSASTSITIPAGGVPAGHGLVISLAAITNALPTISGVTTVDSKGNTYATLHTTTGGTVTTVGAMLYSNISTALVSGDTITLTPDRTTIRLAANVYEFDTGLVPDVTSHFDNGGNSSASMTSGVTAVTAHADELVVGSFVMVNPGRTFTPGAGWSGGTKIMTTNGSGDRAVATEYKFVSSLGTQEAIGTLNSSGTWAASVWAFSFVDDGGGGEDPIRSGRPKVWNGTTWQAYTARVWNGAEWVSYAAKGYNGSEWIASK